MMYPRFTFLHPAWWVGDWWVGNATENYACTLEQRERVVHRSIAVLLYEYIENNADVAQTGTVSSLVFAFSFKSIPGRAAVHNSHLYVCASA